MPKEDRVAVVHDVLTATKSHNVPIICTSTQGKAGLAGCSDNLGIPDHRFDPALMNLIGYGNGVAGADPDLPLPALDTAG